MPTTPRRLRAAGGALATAALATALSAALLFAAPLAAGAAAATTTDPADAAAGWLARQLVDGDHLTTTAGGTVYPDQGLTADAVLAFDAAGVAKDAATKATAWLATPANLSAWIGDGVTEFYAGSIAKAAVVAEAQGEDPTAFGGVDLVTRLRGLEQTSGAQAGRFSDKSKYGGDYSNTFGQSFAVVALERADATGADQAAVDFLAAQQCSDGGFRLELGAPGGTCASDPDATALAVQALLLAGRDAAADKGLDFLAARQQGDGGLGGVGPTAGENSNTTGLAAQAFSAGGRDSAHAKASAYLAGLQQGCSAPAARRGAIAYDAGSFSAATATRATAQAVVGLAGTGLATVTSASSTADVPVLDCPATATPTPTHPTTAPATTPTTAKPAASSVAASRTGSAGPVATLPDTGSTSGPLAALGAGLLVAGAALLWLVRPRRGTHS